MAIVKKRKKWELIKSEFLKRGEVSRVSWEGWVERLYYHSAF
jgi:hypothetical protein